MNHVAATSMLKPNGAEYRYRGLREEVATASGSTNIIFHPFLCGSNVQPTARADSMAWPAGARALIYSRALRGGRIRALGHIEKCAQLGSNRHSGLAGGGSRSPVWSQMFADTVRCRWKSQTETDGARGAALSAGIGSGVYPTLRKPSRRQYVVRVHEPVLADARSIWRAMRNMNGRESDAERRGKS